MVSLDVVHKNANSVKTFGQLLDCETSARSSDMIRAQDLWHSTAKLTVLSQRFSGLEYACIAPPSNTVDKKTEKKSLIEQAGPRLKSSAG
jgi:hypothetical protein